MLGRGRRSALTLDDAIASPPTIGVDHEALDRHTEERHHHNLADPASTSIAHRQAEAEK